MRRQATPLLLCMLLAMPAAHAGLFDDAEARQQIIDLKTKLDQQLDTQAKGQLELVTQITNLREELARLRGQMETLKYENEQLQKRQQDLYVDLDSRLRRIEMPPATPAATSGEAPAATGHTKGSEGDTAAYEAALDLFKAAKYKEAGSAFEAFLASYPESSLAPNAQFWLGNTWYAQRNCKKTIDTQLVVTSRWPDSSKAPDAMIAIANCQRDWGNEQAARRTLENLIAKYPASEAAAQARQRLGKK